MDLSSRGLWPLVLAYWSLFPGECMLALGVRDTGVWNISDCVQEWHRLMLPDASCVRACVCVYFY